MACPLRLAFENAVYHIMSRGIRKERIFYSNSDKFFFIEKMSETFKKYSFVCYAFCLMDNHYHLFLRTKEANISEGMHYLNSSYASWFRAKYKITGSLFQGRYRSTIVDADSYALVLSAYIHLNPVRAHMVRRPDEYHFSSYVDYIGKREPIVANMDMGFILGRFSEDKESAAKRYREYVVENVAMKNPLEDSYKGLILGSDAFVERLKDKIREKVADPKEARELSFSKELAT